MMYKSTRNNNLNMTSSDAILQGIAPGGGLYIPKSFPEINLENLVGLSYQELAIEIFKLFLTDYPDVELKCSVYKAYDEKFENDEIAPVKYFDDYSVLELFHGSTLAFKDMALSVLPYLMKKAAVRKGIEDEIVILTATSGDTGKAALEGFADVDGIKIVVFYPSKGISDIQKHQMTTQSGDNTYVFSIEGNFDDAQTAVKEIFTDDKLKDKLKSDGYVFSSANSINIGRLVPQIVYYVHGYLDYVKKGMIELGDKINVVVPTGNFGNILAARYAKEIGLPIEKFICASNENSVLTDFINTGKYDLRRDFKVTNSPSMDILISSNLERYLSLIGNNTEKYMKELRSKGHYSISKEEKEHMNDFYGDWSSEAETLEEIRATLKESNYLLDTHTAVARNVYRKYVDKTGDKTKTMIVATASPFKFTRSVLEAVDGNLANDNDFKLIDVMSEKFNLAVPNGIKGLAGREVKHPHTIEKTSIKSTIEAILR